MTSRWSPCPPHRAGRRRFAVAAGGRRANQRRRAAGEPVDVAAAAALALARRRDPALLKHRLSLLELNPVIATPAGAIAVDAVARRAATG